MVAKDEKQIEKGWSKYNKLIILIKEEEYK